MLISSTKFLQPHLFLRELLALKNGTILFIIKQLVTENVSHEPNKRAFLDLLAALVELHNIPLLTRYEKNVHYYA
jgi:hypothetical protein